MYNVFVSIYKHKYIQIYINIIILGVLLSLHKWVVILPSKDEKHFIIPKTIPVVPTKMKPLLHVNYHYKK